MNRAGEGREYFAELAPKVLDNGWTGVIPLRGKRAFLPGWSQYNREPLDADTLEDWCRRYPRCNVGMPASGFVAVDSDILDADAARDVAAIAVDILGDTPAVRIGRAPKWVRLYRPDGVILSTARAPVEVFASSGVIAAFGIHPDTGREYCWPHESPLWLSPDDLPPITAAQVAAFLEAATARAGRRGNPTAAPFGSELADERRGKRGRAWVETVRRQLREAKPGDLHNTLISVVAALARRGFSDTAIKSFVAENFAAPRQGKHGAVWGQVDDAIATARRRWSLQPSFVRPESEAAQ